MRRGRKLFPLVLSMGLMLGFWGCSPQDDTDPAAEKAAADLAYLQEQKPVLDAKREELAELKIRLKEGVPEGEAAEEAESADGEGAPGEAAEGGTAEPMTEEEVEARITGLEEEVLNLSEELVAKSVEYLNITGITVDGELTPDQEFAAQIKIDEDIVVGKEYIEKGGDYARALEIFSSAKPLDPDNEALLSAIAEAETNRYMSEERFIAAKKKMTQDEVRDVLGQVKLSNIRDFPDRAVVGWFYRKEDGGAAAVYFKETKAGSEKWIVYDTDYNAVERQVQGGGGGAGGGDGEGGDG